MQHQSARSTLLSQTASIAQAPAAEQTAEQQRLNILRGMVQTSTETRECTYEAQAELARQDEQIRQSIRTMQSAQEGITRSEKILKSMRSPFSFISDLFSSSTKKKDKQLEQTPAKQDRKQEFVRSSQQPPSTSATASLTSTSQSMFEQDASAREEEELWETLSQRLGDLKEGALAIRQEVQRSNQDLQTLTKMVDRGNDGLRRARADMRTI